MLRDIKLAILFIGVRGKLDTVNRGEYAGMGAPPPMPAPAGLEVELARVHAMLAHNSKVYKVFIYTALIFYPLFYKHLLVLV